jgi:hypothetical protein
MTGGGVVTATTRRQRIAHARSRSRRTPVWWRDAIGVLCWINVLVVIVL